VTALATSALDGNYHYGASFIDTTTGIRWEAHHPAMRPDRWDQYLNGALAEYQKYGLAHLIDVGSLRRAIGVSMFFVGFDADGRAAGGMRCHGPLDDAEASRALSEMATSSEVDELMQYVRTTVPHGVIECKGAWRSASGDGVHLVAATLGRCVVHALHWLGAEVALGAVAERLQPLSTITGAVMMGAESAAFPTERYRTVLLAWQRASHGPGTRADQAALIRQENEQLRSGPLVGEDVGWQPVVLDPRQRSDRQVLANLRSDPGIDVMDVARRQRSELEALLPAPDPDIVSEGDRYVYYPWRKLVVRMLGPRAFPLVRLDRNRNRITAKEQERLRSQRIGVVGLSAGHPIAITLALEGLCGELRLADGDEVELTNLNRLPTGVTDIGLNKAVLAARRVAEIDPYLPVRIVTEGVTGDNVDDFVAGLDVLVEECDSVDMKLLLREVARSHHVPVLMETSDRGLLDVERFDREPERPILHDLLPGVTAAALAELPPLARIPVVLDIVDPSLASARGAASLAELGRTLSSWPQLAGDVTLGGATVAAAVRRLGLGEPLPSGRIRVDLDTLVSTVAPPMPAAERPRWPEPPPEPVRPATDDLATVVAHAASLAPSGGNAQPWRFVVDGDALSIELDRQRTSTMDVRSRGSLVAIGAALFNARVAASSLGRLGEVRLFPDGPASDVVATLTLGRERDEELASLYPDVLSRAANRRRGPRQPLDPQMAEPLAAAAAAEGGGLRLVTTEEQLQICAEILGASERVRFLTERLHREMVSELRFAGEDLTTGIDVRTLELLPAEQAALQILRRGDVMELLEEWDAGAALGDNARGGVLLSSALAVVTVPSSSPTSYVHGGSAVERLWVTAQQAGLGVQPVSPVFVFAVQDADFATLGGDRWGDELRVLSDRFRRAVNLDPADTVALVLRLSQVPPPSVRSQRRPLEQVLSVNRRAQTGG
jgi:hypothetical protein